MAEIPVKPEGEGARKAKTWILWIIAALVVIVLFFMFYGRSTAQTLTSSQSSLQNSPIAAVTVADPSSISLELTA